jgi:hypothetical protein
MDGIKSVCWDDVDWIELAQDRDKYSKYYEYGNELMASIKFGSFPCLGRSQCPRGLRRGSAAERSLR